MSLIVGQQNILTVFKGIVACYGTLPALIGLDFMMMKRFTSRPVFVFPLLSCYLFAVNCFSGLLKWLCLKREREPRRSAEMRTALMREPSLVLACEIVTGGIYAKVTMMN